MPGAFLQNMSIQETIGRRIDIHKLDRGAECIERVLHKFNRILELPHEDIDSVKQARSAVYYYCNWGLEINDWSGNHFDTIEDEWFDNKLRALIDKEKDRNPEPSLMAKNAREICVAAARELIEYAGQVSSDSYFFKHLIPAARRAIFLGKKVTQDYMGEQIDFKWLSEVSEIMYNLNQPKAISLPKSAPTNRQILEQRFQQFVDNPPLFASLDVTGSV